MRCLDEGEIALFFEGRLDPSQIDRLEGHLDGCPACLSLMAAVAPAVGVGGQEMEPPSLLRVGDVLADRYEVQRVLGAGATGYVYQAHDRLVDLVLALKVLRPRLSDDPAWVRAFSEELQLGRRLTHPNVCRVFDMQQTEGHCFFTMELAARGSLRDQLRTAAARPLLERLDDAIALASGLAAIHAAGIVHRDVKPANVLRLDDGRLVLSDFGLARASAVAAQSSGAVGTPAYIAPEVARGGPTSLRSDVWSLGVTLHELLFGGPPADGGARPARGPGEMTVALARLCRDCLAVDPGARPLDARSVLDRLRKIQRQPLRQRRRRIWAAALGLAGLTAGGALLTYRVTRPGPLLPDDVITRVVIARPTTEGSVPAEHLKMVERALEDLPRQLAGSPYLRIAREPRVPPAPEDYALEVTVKPSGDQGLALIYAMRGADKARVLGTTTSREAARAMRFAQPDPGIAAAPRSPIGDSLQLFALRDIKRRWVDSGTRSPAARAALRSLADGGGGRDTASPALVLGSLDLALKEDPDYLAAHIERALVHTREALGRGQRNPAPLIADERALAQRAPDSPRSLAARCRLLQTAVSLTPGPSDADFAAAVAVCRRAIATPSIGPGAYRWLAKLQVATCEPGAAVRSLRQALEHPSHEQVDFLGEWAAVALREHWPHQGWLDPWLSNFQVATLLPSSPLRRSAATWHRDSVSPLPLTLMVASLWLRQGSLERAHDRFRVTAQGHMENPSQNMALLDGLSLTEARLDAKAHPPVEERPTRWSDEELEDSMRDLSWADRFPLWDLSVPEVLSWTNPSRARRLLQTVEAPNTCQGAIKLATTQRSLAVPPDRGAIAKLCPANAAWVRRCLDDLGTPLGGGDPLPGAPSGD